ncbi:MAG: DUF4375 domain-containing protein, partial [Oxalobacteraceae bacterium]
SGQDRLTAAQRTLLMWSDIVGQVSNGGFTQYCQNYAAHLSLGVAAVEALAWPELSDRFARAMTEQAGDVSAPRWIEPIWPADDPELWAASRARFMRFLAGKGKPWWRPITARDLAAVEAQNDDWELASQYREAVRSGDLASGGERFLSYVEPAHVEAEAFDDWFYSAEAKAASVQYVHGFILRRRNQLYRTI